MASSYCLFTDVTVRAGRWQALFTVSGKHPNQTDVESLVAQVSSEIAAAIAARGHNPDLLPTPVSAAFIDLAAYGALARAIAAVPDSPKELATLLAVAREIWAGAMGDPAGKTAQAVKGSIATGTFPGIALLEASDASGASAGDFWSENPDAGSPNDIESEASRLWPATAPAFAKGQRL